MTLGQFIKKIRKSKKITQAELAEMIGKKTITIRKYESDEITPSIEILEKVAESLSIDVWDLLGASTKTPFNPVDCIPEEDREFAIDGNEVNLPPISFEKMKSDVDKLFPVLQAEIDFLSNPVVEKTFNYSFNELAINGGYQELLISAVEKAIISTLENIQFHIENGDIFDGVNSWISKDSPLYAILEKHKKEK